MRPNSPACRTSICLILSLCFWTGIVAHTNCAIADEEPPSVHEVGQIKLKHLRELSGIAASKQNPGVLWVHNDGSSKMLFAVDTSGKPVALVNWPGEIEDFEDIAIGPGPKTGVDYLYIGDIGDNTERRREIRVVRFAEPQLSEASGGQITVEAAEIFRLVYPDGARNAEALMVDPQSGDLFIVTKEKRTARLFTVPASQLKDNAVQTLALVANLDIRNVSGGDISRDGSRIILRREDQGWLWSRAQNQSVAAALRATPQEVPVRGNRQGRNGEAVSFSPGGLNYFTASEGKQPIICEFPLPKPAPAPAQ